MNRLAARYAILDPDDLNDDVIETVTSERSLVPSADVQHWQRSRVERVSSRDGKNFGQNIFRDTDVDAVQTMLFKLDLTSEDKVTGAYKIAGENIVERFRNSCPVRFVFRIVQRIER